MISEVVMPQMGADMTEGTVLRWLKHEGDPVTRGEIIAEIETDKANVEIEAFDGGTFRKALADEGETVHVGEVIAVIGDTNDDVSKYADGSQPKQAEPAAGGKSASQEQQAPATETKQAVASAAEPPPTERAPVASSDAAPEAEATPASDQPPTPSPPQEARPAQRPAAAREPTPTDQQQAPSSNGRVRASPLARKIAQERGLDLHQIRGSGPGGRILRHDVEESTASATPSQPASPAASAPPPGAGGVVRMSRMRQAIARRMSQSKREAPHYYLLLDIDMTDAMAFRRQFNEVQPEDAHASVNDQIVRACALALQRHPMFNATIAGDEVTRHDQQNVCIGIALDDGLIAPAILDAGRKPLVQIARETKDLIRRAKGGSLRADEITGGTFTITNLGAYGIETLIGIIQPPQTAILGVGSVMDQPVIRDGAVVVRQMMKVALSADHRVTDGAQGAQFLAEIKQLLEKPLRLVL